MEYMNKHTSRTISCTIHEYEDNVKATFIYMTPLGNKRMTRKYKSLEIDIDVDYGNTIVRWDEFSFRSQIRTHHKYINYYDERKSK